MTKKDLFRLIIKIFGLYSLIVTLFSILPSSISWVLMDSMFFGLVLIIASVIVVIALFGFLIFRADTVIAWLKLDKGFDDERIEFQNFNAENILKLAVIIIGGVLLLNNVPNFLGNCLYLFKSATRNEMSITSLFSFDNSAYGFYWLVSTINIFIAYLLLTNYTYVSKILRKREEKNGDTSLE